MGSGAFSRKDARDDRVLDAVGQPATVVDVSGRILSFNRAAAEAHGWAHSEIIGRNLLEVMPALDSDSTAEPERRILSGRAVVRGVAAESTRWLDLSHAR